MMVNRFRIVTTAVVLAIAAQSAHATPVQCENCNETPM